MESCTVSGLVVCIGTLLQTFSVNVLIDNNMYQEREAFFCSATCAIILCNQFQIVKQVFAFSFESVRVLKLCSMQGRIKVV